MSPTYLLNALFLATPGARSSPRGFEKGLRSSGQVGGGASAVAGNSLDFELLESRRREIARLRTELDEQRDETFQLRTSLASAEAEASQLRMQLQAVQAALAAQTSMKRVGKSDTEVATLQAVAQCVHPIGHPPPHVY